MAIAERMAGVGPSTQTEESKTSGMPVKTGLARYGGNFDLLDQNGHFRIPEPPFTSAQRRAWRASLTVGERIEFNTLRSHVLQLFGVDSLPKIRDVLADPQKKEERTAEANRILARRFGIQGSDEFIKGKLGNYFNTAVHEREEEASQLGKVIAFELSNIVATTSNVLELLELAFFARNKQVRFEAGKILDGMEGAAAADRVRREEETARFLASPHTRAVGTDRRSEEQKDPDLAEINNILDKYFYSSDPPSESTLFLSRHAADDFRVLGIDIVPPKQAKIARFKKAPARHLYTELPERTITHDGVDTPAYTTVRRKTIESTVRKGRRKGTKNIRKAVEDAIGMKIIVPNIEDIPRIHDKLVQTFIASGHSFTILEQEDSLSGGPYSANNPGSSDLLRIIKIVAEIGPWLAEIQYFDRRAYIDSTAQNIVSHKEFELNRLYDSGVPQHDFPEHIYGQPHERIRKARIREIRSGIRIGLFRGEDL